MKPVNPPTFPQGKVLEIQRSLGLGGSAYICPHCAASYNQEPKLWSHVKEIHRSNLKSIGSTKEDEDQERDRYKQWAFNMAHDRQTTLKPPISEKARGNTAASTQKRSASPQRPSTAPEEPSRENKKFSRLNIGDVASPSSNPRKRGPGPNSFSEAPSGRDQVTHSQSRPKHTRAASNSQAVDRDYQRQQNPSLGAPRLFEHKTDEANTTRNLPRKAKTSGNQRNHQQHTSKHPTSNKQVQYESEMDTRLPFQVNLGSPGSIHVLQPNINIVQKPTNSRVSETPAGDSSTQNNPVEDSAEPDDPEPDTVMLRQPETRPISHDQLVVEVKGIYAGLVMVEAKCIEVDEKQTTSAPDKDGLRRQAFTNDQWRSLIALHKQLLHEHHDFFLASQHPSASSNLSKLAEKYSMPARMWRHGIHAFLEVLRHRLPQSLDHMLAFIYIAYSMMALLYETVPSFESTWIECLGDLARYRMAIEDDEPRDREVWSNVAKYWYSKASDKSPYVGRLYHHLAILARPYTLEQHSLYTRSLICVTPFESARGSIMTLLNPILAGRISQYHRIPEIETIFIKAHGILFTYPQRSQEDFRLVLDQIKGGVINVFFQDKKMNEHRWKKVGAFLALSNISGLFEYGALASNGKQRSPMRRAFETAKVKKEQEIALQQVKSVDDTPMQGAPSTKCRMGFSTSHADVTDPLTLTEAETSSVIRDSASELAFLVFEYALNPNHWISDSRLWTHMLPLVHVMMILIYSCVLVEGAIRYIERFIPWNALCVYLNKLAAQPNLSEAKVHQQEFPIPSVGVGRPLWEDYLLRGLPYTLWYFPDNWFADAGIDDEERQLETASMDNARAERVLWIGHCIAALAKWIRFNKEARKFEVPERATKIADAEAQTSADGCVQPNVSATDSVMADIPISDVSSSNASTALTEAVEVPFISSSSSTTTLPQDILASEPSPVDPTTPRAGTAQEHDNDEPMVWISPGKIEQAADPLATSVAMPVETPPASDPGTSPKPASLMVSP